MLLATALFLLAATISAEEGFSYKKNSLGPGQWGCLQKNWTKCRTGSQQSPIHIKSYKAIDNCELGKLNFHFSKCTGTLVTEQYVYRIFLDPAAKNTLKINGMTYKLIQFHFHHPSEHLIDGKKFELEMHLVYQDNSSKLAVVTQMFKKGKENSLIAQALEIKKGNVNTTLDLKQLNLGGEYYRYEGSLTTPPCTEGVMWTIFLKVKTASEQQIKDIKKYLKGKNARPLQRLNGREIYIFSYYQSFLQTV